MEMIRTWAERNRSLLGLAAVFALALLLRCPIASIPLERDEGEYAYIAQRWLQGEVPYKETFDQKPPGIFALYALFISCIGTSAAAIHWGMQIYTLGTLVLVYWLGKRLFSETAGLTAAALCAFMTSAPCFFGHSANTEMAMILPLTAGLAATLRAVESASARWSLLAGVCAAAALLCKQVALFPVALYPLLIVTGARAGRWRMLGAMVLGGVAPLAVVVGYFVWHDAWHDCYDCVIGHNLSYAGRIPLVLYPFLLLNPLFGLITISGPIYWLAGGAAIGGWRIRPSSSPGPHYPGPVALLVLWLILSLLSVVVGGRFFEHYFVTTIPATALLAGIRIDTLMRRGSDGRLENLRAHGLAALVIGYGIAVGWWYYLPGALEEKSRKLYSTNIFVSTVRVGQFLAEDSRPDDTIFVLGCEPEVFYYADRKSASRYIYAYPLVGSTADARRRQQAVLQELTDKPPNYVVIIFNPQHLLYQGDLHESQTDWCDGILELIRRSYEVAMVQPIEKSEPANLTGKAAAEMWDEHPTSYKAGAGKYCIVVYRRLCPKLP